MIIQRGEIYSLDFGRPQGSVQGGVRPALIIQNDTGNLYSPTTIVAAITSKQKKRYRFHVEISTDGSGLPEASTILLEQIQTIPKNLLVKKVGGIDKRKMLEVDQAIHDSLALGEHTIESQENKEKPNT